MWKKPSNLSPHLPDIPQAAECRKKTAKPDVRLCISDTELRTFARQRLKEPCSLARKSTRHHPGAHLACPCLAQGARQLIDRCATGHDIVHHGDMLSLQIHSADKCLAHVFPPLLPRQRRLRQRVAHTLASPLQQRNFQLVRNPARQLQRLVEAAFAQARRVQRHGHDAVRAGLDALHQPACQLRCQQQLFVELQRPDQRIHRKGIGKYCHRAVKSRRMAKATPANRAIRRGQGAHRAVRCPEIGQGGIAWPAPHACAAHRTAQQARLGR